ncbi:MAG: glycosyl hydrolase 53 family protein, partial [Bacteroidetes bacterium]|nr:glycosyl hydrolase 53 family protein [Bacteroidota bacterium]
MIKKIALFLSLFALMLLTQCNQPTKPTGDNEAQPGDFSDVSRVTNGKPVSVMLTCYSTTLLANGTDHTRVRVALVDSLNREITSASDSIRIFVTGAGKVTDPMGPGLPTATDTNGVEYGLAKLENGVCNLQFIAGSQPDKVKVEVRADGCWAGSHEIHTLPADFKMMKPDAAQLKPTTKPIGRMIGADISFLPQIEDRGIEFTENGDSIDAVNLLAEHGFNYIRLRIFVNPENEKGYAPEDGYCGLPYTLAMAKRVKAAGMKLLLDFHYSDYWADPQQQYKPAAWADLDFEALKDSVKTYTTRVLLALDKQGILPDMVQVGNEINHGLLWPDGHIGNPDQLAALLKAGAEGVEAADPAIPVMMHLALGGQNQEAVFWLDNMITR